MKKINAFTGIMSLSSTTTEEIKPNKEKDKTPEIESTTEDYFRNMSKTN